MKDYRGNAATSFSSDLALLTRSPELPWLGPCDLGMLGRWASRGRCQAVPPADPGPVPEPGCSLRPRFQDTQTLPAASESKGLLQRGEPQIWEFLLPAHPS